MVVLAETVENQAEMLGGRCKGSVMREDQMGILKTAVYVFGYSAAAVGMCILLYAFVVVVQQVVKK